MAHQSIDKSLLQTFVPVNALSGDQLDWLLDQQEVRRYEAGDVLFRQGDRDNTTIYLLSGEVELFSEHGERTLISAGDSASWHPLGHFQPRRDDCKAVGEVSVVRFDSFRLDTILSWDQSAGYVILDINANAAYQHDREWMIRLLKSKLFHRVPQTAQRHRDHGHRRRADAPGPPGFRCPAARTGDPHPGPRRRPRAYRRGRPLAGCAHRR